MLFFLATRVPWVGDPIVLKSREPAFAELRIIEIEIKRQTFNADVSFKRITEVVTECMKTARCLNCTVPSSYFRNRIPIHRT